MPEWESISGGRSNFYGWAEEIGQNITGKILSVHEGKDRNGIACPELTIAITEATRSFAKGEWTDYEAGTVVTLTCGLANLKKNVVKAQLGVNDMVSITLDSLFPTAKSPAKIFDLKVARGEAPTPTAVQEDPWASSAPSFAGFGDDALKPSAPF